MRKGRSASDGKKRSAGPRAQVILEWRGALDPLNLNQNVSKATDWIESILAEAGIEAGGVSEEEVKSAWRSLAGEVIASQTDPVSLKRGCLTLKVLQPTMRFHLEQLKGPLLKRLQDELGADNIKSLRLVIG